MAKKVKMKIKFSTIKPYLPIVLIITLALVLRLFALINYGDFWSDEMFSFTYSQKHWLQSWQFWVWETNPPLHMLLLKLWFLVFPANEVFARIPSVLFGLTNIIILYTFCKKQFTNKNIATTTALLLALNPLHILYSATNRTYTLLLLLATISTILFYQLFIEEKKDKKTIIYFAIINLLLLYSHITALMFFGCQLIVLFAFKKSLTKWIKYNIIPGLLWLIWAIPSISAKLSIETAQNSWFFNLRDIWSLKFANLQLILLGPITSITSAVLLVTLIVGTLGLLIYQKRKSFDPKLFFIIIFATLPIITAFFTNFNAPKFFLISLPWLIVLISYIIHHFYNRQTIITPVILFAYCFGIILLFQHFPLSNWAQVNNFLNSNYNSNKKQLLIYDSYANRNEINRYIKNEINKIPYIPTENSNMDWDKMLITQNYFRLRPALSELKLWATENSLTTNENIFILQYPTDNFVSIDLVSAFKELGYKTTKQTPTEIFNNPTLYLLEKIHE